MSSARLSETICAGYRLVQGPSARAEGWHDLPVSRLLAIEKHRGLSEHYKCQFTRRPTPWQCRDGVRGQPACRFFSSTTHAHNPPPKRPPRPPGTLARTVPSPVTTLPDFAIVTGAEVSKKQRVEQEQVERERREIRGLTHAIAKISGLAEYHFGKDYPPATAHVIPMWRHEAYTEGVRRWREYMRKRLDSMTNLGRRLQIAASWFESFEATMKANLQYAREQGILEGLYMPAWQAYCDRHLLPVEDRVAAFIDHLRHLDICLRELHYTIDWWQWYAQKVHFQSTEATAHVTDMKKPDGLHAHLNDALRYVADSFSDLKGIIRTENIIDHRVSETLSSADATVNALHHSGHTFRRLNRIYELGLRFPTAYSPIWLELKLRSPLDDVIDNILRSLDVVDKAYLHIPRPTPVGQTLHYLGHEWVIIWGRMSELLYDTLDLATNGLALSNPSMQSTFGTCLYSMIKPFNRHLVGDKRLMHVMSSLVRSWGNVEDPSSTMLRILDCVRDMRRVRRDVNFLLTVLYHDVVAGILLTNNSPRSLPSFAIDKAAAAQEVKDHRACAELSHLPLYSTSHSLPTSIIDPLALRGGNDLYPVKTSIRVEYATSNQTLANFIAEVYKNRVFGFELMIGHAGKTRNLFVKYCTLATIDKVVIVELAHDQASISLLKSLLEDTTTIKVTYGLAAVSETLARDNIVPRNVVDVSANATMGGDARGISRTLSSPVHKVPRRGWAPINDISWIIQLRQKGMRAVFCDLAMQPMYSLITFVNAVASDASLLVGLCDNTRADILDTVNDFQMMANQNTDSKPILGPLIWLGGPLARSWGFPARLASFKAMGNGGSHFSNLLSCATNMARFDLREGALKTHFLRTGGSQNFKLKDLGSDSMIKRLAAYYLFTTFALNLNAISHMLETPDPAADILDIATTLALRLNPQHSEHLSSNAGRAFVDSQPLAVDRIISYGDNEIAALGEASSGTTHHASPAGMIGPASMRASKSIRRSQARRKRGASILKAPLETQPVYEAEDSPRPAERLGRKGGDLSHKQRAAARHIVVLNAKKLVPKLKLKRVAMGDTEWMRRFLGSDATLLERIAARLILGRRVTIVPSFKVLDKMVSQLRQRRQTMGDTEFVRRFVENGASLAERTVAGVVLDGSWESLRNRNSGTDLGTSATTHRNKEKTATKEKTRHSDIFDNLDEKKLTHRRRHHNHHGAPQHEPQDLDREDSNQAPTTVAEDQFLPMGASIPKASSTTELFYSHSTDNARNVTTARRTIGSPRRKALNPDINNINAKDFSASGEEQFRSPFFHNIEDTDTTENISSKINET